MNTSDFRFFRSVEGQIFMRPGTGIAVGATRSPTGWAFQPEINAIPKAEIQKFFAEYSRAFRSGALAECTAAEFEAENQDITTVATKPKKKSKESEA